MQVNTPIIKDANLVNTLNSKGFSLANKGYIIDRNDIIQNYSQEVIDSCWESLSTNIIQNYQRGRGTLIKGFGTFTLRNAEYNLEGTTNQYIRDIKPKIPVFIVSKELNEKFCPAEYTKQNGIRYYTQKESKDVPIVKINYAEIAYSISLSKDEICNIIKHLFNHINESIINKSFKNKVLPGLGILVNRNNLLAVNFNENFVIKNKTKNQKNNFTKKNVFLDMDFDQAQNVMADKCLTPYKNVNDLKATKSLKTTLEKSGNDFMKENYSIDVQQFPQHIMRSVYRHNNTCNSKGQPNFPFTFLNDNKKKMNEKFNNNSENLESNDMLNFLDDETLKTIEYYKGMMIKNCKNYDHSGSCRITKEEAIKALVETNINNKIDYNIAKKIIETFSKTENVEYMKFIAQLVKNCRIILLKRNSKSDNNISINSNSNIFKRENYFSLKKPNMKKIGNSTFTSGFYKPNTPKYSGTPRVFSSVSKSQNNSGIKFEEEEKNRNVTSCQSSRNNNNKLLKTEGNLFSTLQKETDVIKQLLKPIVNLIPKFKRDYFISLDQRISWEEFRNILHKYNILYPKSKVIDLLKFIDIPDIDAFSLREFDEYLKACKIIETSIGLSELNKIMKNLKDIIYINGGEKFFFGDDKNSIDKETFINLLKDKTNLDYDTLSNVFTYLVKTDREFDKNDYKKYFDNVKIIFDEPYYLSMMRKIIELVYDKKLKAEEYFDKLVLNNVSSLDKVVTKINWIKYLQKEKLGFSAEELDKLFIWIDTKKDNVLDKEEFVQKFNHTIKPLTLIQEIVRENHLDIEDLAHHMGIKISEIENYDFETFKQKLKKLNYTYPDIFMQNVYNELLKKSNSKLLNSKYFLDEINYIKPPENYQSFTQNYMNKVRSKISHDALKTQLEKYDKECSGKLSKLAYVTAIANINLLPEYTDEDHMRFIRVTDMFDKNGNVDYPEMLNLIFFYNKEKLSDPFTKLCQILSNLLQNDCGGDVERLMYLISKGTTKKANSLNVHKPLTVEQISNFMKRVQEPISNKIINKLDIDADGYISYNDLKAVLKRFIYTSFFKYTNDSNNPDINLFSAETMSNTVCRSLIKKIQLFMKMQNLTETGLFKKFDKDDDGFISCVDFNIFIDEIVSISPALKDQFFNYLDFYHNGLVDYETFIKRMKDYTSGDILVQNNNKIENEILEKMREFVIKNNKLSDNEIFEVIDKDCDGLISLNDLKLFIINNLFISEIEFNKSKLERVMMSLSLSKNSQIGLNDIREFINLCNANKNHMNLKEVFKITTNQNLSKLKLNKEWTNDIIERLGMFVSEKYESIEQFFNENSEPGTNKFTFNDFLNFHQKNYELFNNGFNLTKDELLSIFTSLDSHKKNFLTLRDLKNKLQIFNFYNKMHIDVKNFIQENFANGIDAFKFFIKSNNHIEKIDQSSNDNKNKNYITLKEFFDAFDNFFPDKYPTNTILKYLNKYFNINISNTKNNLLNKKDTISFSEFNYLYFDTFKDSDYFTKHKNDDTKMLSNRIEVDKKTQNDLLMKSQSNFYYSNLFKKKFDYLSTPFDNDPLNKVKRVLCSSKYNLNKFFESAALETKNDKFIVNKYQFRNIIKDLDIGLTNLEIDQIMFKCGKITYDGNLNLRDFIRYLYNQNYTLEEGKKNIGKIMGEIKSLIYKYYSNPIVCFQNNDTAHTGKIDFDKFKNIIFDMYERDEAKIPNFTLIKNAYDTIDLRKDGIIDMNEWCKSFGSFNGKLDVLKEDVSNGLEFFDKKFKNKNNFQNPNKIDHNRKILREWENSGDITIIYKFINKNRKLIKQKIKDCNFLLGSDGVQLVHTDNLINIIKDIIPNLRISQTQWKMIVNIAKNERVDNLIDINEFFKIMEITSKNLMSHPIVRKKSKKSNIDEYSGLNSNGVGYKTMTNGFYYDRRSNSINRDKKGFKELTNSLNNPFGKYNRAFRQKSESKLNSITYN